jgi:hypothetical protein
MKDLIIKDRHPLLSIKPRAGAAPDRQKRGGARLKLGQRA